jgi:succinate-semialdehyde dehydrogenase/glutarate-semialdehyde dehydrogenase
MSTTIAASYSTYNPATGALLEHYENLTTAQIGEALDNAVATQRRWRTTSFGARAELLKKVGRLLRERKSHYAFFITREMGKPLAEAEAEVLKCATACDWFAEHAAALLADEETPSNAARSYVAFRPLGVLLAIMPWNYPFWQVIRAAAPALMAGNVIVLKHAANVTACALALFEVFRDAGFPTGTFSAILVDTFAMEPVVADERIAAVTLTGSEGAGSAVGAAAGRAIKKVVLELGGSDAYIVLADADLDAAAATGVRARFQNTGQSCIAAKRFIIEDAVYDAFVERFVAGAKALAVGDPMLPETTIGPLARTDLRDELHRQVQATIAAGATLLLGGAAVDGLGAFYQPTVVGDVRPGMAMADEETFGPAAALMRARDAEHAVELANSSRYGLGGSLWTRDLTRAAQLAARIESGAVFINGMTASDPRLPFGGVKRSGHGRELGEFGIREFVNVQTVWIGPAS